MAPPAERSAEHPRLDLDPPDVSIVVPVLDESESLGPLIEAVWRETSTLPYRCEVVVVDDGSSDGTRDVLATLAERHANVRGVVLRRNFGQSSAVTAGFDAARGRIVVTMDGDGQNDPADIAVLLAALERGYDVVSGWRRLRRDAFLSRTLPSRLANWLIGWTTGLRLNDYGCSLKAYRRDVLHGLVLYGELHRFIPALVSVNGARVTEVAVRHHPRTTGRSKYGFGRLPRVLLDLALVLFFQRFATRPLQLFGRAGGLLGATGLAVLLYLTTVKLLRGVSIGARPLLLLGVLLVLGGMMLFSIGLLAELVVRTYYESAGRKIYAVRELLG